MAVKNTKINKLKIYYDSLGKTLNVWFDDPQKEHHSEESGEEVILNKDKNGRVIGFEKLNFTPQQQVSLKSLPIEVVVV